MIQENTTLTQIINEIKATNWSLFNGPKLYRADKVSVNLLKLTTLTNESNRLSVYNDILSTVGNSHGGTFYPAILKALPLIIKIIEISKSELIQHCGLEILNECCCSFDPELGKYNLTSAEQLGEFVKVSIKEFLGDIKFDNSNRNRELAEDMLLCVNE